MIRWSIAGRRKRRSIREEGYRIRKAKIQARIDRAVIKAFKSIK